MRWCFAHYRRLFLLVFVSLLVSLASEAHSVKQIEDIASEAPSLEAFLADSKLQARYEGALRAYQSRDRFRCESFGKIIAKLKILSEAIPDFGERLWTKHDTAPLMLDAIANGAEQNATTSAKTKYAIYRLPRNFHGLFFDPSPAGCLSENCSEADYFSPDRWAPALKDSEVYVVEKNGLFTDLTLLVTPVKQGKKVFGLVSMGGGPGLGRQQTLRITSEKTWRRSSLLNAWLKVATRSKPVAWQGYVRMRRPQSKQPAVRQIASETSRERQIGKPEQFSSTEDLGLKIRTALPNQCLAGVKDAQKYLLGLSNEPAATMMLIAAGSLQTIDVKSSKAVSEFLSTAVTPTQLAGLAEISPTQVNQFKTTVTNLMLNAKSPEDRANAGLALASLGEQLPKAVPPAETIPNFTKALKDSNPTVREIAGLGLLEAGAPGRTGVGPVSNAFQPGDTRSFPAHFPEFLERAAGALGDKSDPQGLDRLDRFLRKPGAFPDDLKDSTPFRNALAGATSALVKNGVPIDKNAVGSLIDNFSRTEDPQERAQFRDFLVDLMRDNKDPRATVEALENAERNPKTRDLAREVREEANRDKPDCDENGNEKEGR